MYNVFSKKFIVTFVHFIFSYHQLWNSLISSLLPLQSFLFFFLEKTIKEKINPDQTKNYTIDDEYNAAKREREKEIDQLLSKMGKTRIADLERKRPKRLEELSKK